LQRYVNYVTYIAQGWRVTAAAVL